MSTKIVRNKDEVLHVYANVQDETVTVPDVTFSPATLSIHGGGGCYPHAVTQGWWLK